MKEELTISQMVRNDYRTAEVFKKWGINYCCGGNKSLEEVCRVHKLDQASLEKDLEHATQTLNISNALQFDKWSVEFLVDYIINVHHAYVRQTLPVLAGMLDSFVEGHKKKHPELEKVQEVFNQLKEEILEHTQKEEESIFPYFKQISNTHKRKETYGSLFVRTLSKPFDEIENKEHRRISALLIELRKATNEYVFADTACTNHQVIYQKLKEFDVDMVQHKHLENNVLFPKIRLMEQELLKL